MSVIRDLQKQIQRLVALLDPYFMKRGAFHSFPSHSDVPVYAGGAGLYVKVNATEDAVEWDTPPGAGDMTKAVYDTDDDGVVDDSEKLEGSNKAQVQDHTAKAHVVNSTGPHAEGGLTIGHTLRASGTAAFSFAQLQHADLGGVTADLHHAGFIGLEDNAATAIVPAADDRIQITDDGVINADASGNTLALSIAQGQIDHGSIGGLVDNDHTQYFLLAGETTNAQLHSGADLIVYSDAGVTEKARIDGATGNITTVGTVDGIDVSAHDVATTGVHGAGANTLIHSGHTIADLTAPIADFSMNTHKITGLVDPTADQQAATKKYVDDTAGGSSLYAFKTITGITNDVVADSIADTLTLTSANGKLTIVGTAATDTITFAVVEAQIDHGSIGGLGDDDHTQYFLLAGETTDAKLYSGADLIVYSDAGVTEKTRIDGATGNISAVKIITSEIENSGNITLDAFDAAVGRYVYILNSDVTYKASLDVEDSIVVGGTVDGVDIAGFNAIQFVVLTADANVANERILTAGDGLDLTDGGAGNNVTLAVDVTDILGSGLTENANNIDLDWGTPTISTIECDDAASAGTSTNPTRSDHKHAIVCAAPGTNLSVSSSNVEGTAVSFARSDHAHAITTSSNPGAAVSILASSAAGHLTLVQLNTDTIADKSGGNLAISPAGDVIFDPTGNDLLPNTGYDLNIGSLVKKYLTLHVAELWVETLVAQNTIATIGGRILVGPTTMLTRDLTSAATTIYVKHSEMANGDRVYMEADGKVEFMSVDSAPTASTELLSNVGFETAGAGGADVWANWTESAGDGALANETTIIHGGADACKVTAGASANTYVKQAAAVTAGLKYKAQFWTRGDGTYAGRFKIYDATNAADIIAIRSTDVPGTTYLQKTVYFIAPVGCSSVELYLYCPSVNTGIAYFDDTSAALAEYSYTVTRNLDGTGANEWNAGDAVFNTGATGDGFIDIYSVHGIKAVTEYGPTIVGNIRNSATYNDWTPHWAVGNLNGLYGYSSTAYGVAFGKYSAADYITIDTTNGIRFLDSTDVVRAQLASGNWTLGYTTNEHVSITNTAVQIKDGVTVYTELVGGALTLGDVNNEHALINTSGVALKDGATVYALFAATTTIGVTTTEHISISSTAVQIKDGATVYTELTAGELILGDNDVAQDWISISSANGIRLYGNNTLHFQVQPDGDVFIGEDAADPLKTNVAILTTAGYYNGENLGVGDMILGNNADETFEVTITDNTESMKTAFQSGELYVANGNAVPPVGCYFEVLGTGDFTGDDLATAKGAAVAANDFFRVDNNGIDTEAVTYLGNAIANRANVWWDKSAGILYFRGGQTAQAYIDTTGAITAGAGAVMLDADGMSMTIGAAYAAPAAIKFLTVGDDLVSAVWATYSAPTARTYLKALPSTDTHSQLYLEADVPVGYNAEINITVSIAGTEQSQITLNDDGTIDVTATLKVSSDLRVGGGLYVGQTGVDPDADWIYADGGMYINDTSNAGMTIGLTINQGANDDEILALKSSDVAHGMTTYAETDTFGAGIKRSATSGGLQWRGFSEATIGLSLIGFAVSDDTAKTTAGTAYVLLETAKRDGAGPGAIAAGADANLVAIQNWGTTRFIFDAEGSAHADVEWTVFDEFDDLALLSDFETAMLAQRDPVKAEMVDFLRYNREVLEHANIVHFDKDNPGHAMVNFTRLSMLLVGAIRQMSGRIESVEQLLLAA